jgi:hypothetical protein
MRVVPEAGCSVSRFLQWSGLLSHLRSYERYDEPETLPYSIRPFCPMSADAGQPPRRLIGGVFQSSTISRPPSTASSWKLNAEPKPSSGPQIPTASSPLSNAGNKR